MAALRPGSRVILRLQRLPHTSTRNLTTACPLRAAAARSDGEQDAKSYVRALFLGRVQSGQVLPYPDVLTDDERETASLLVQPIGRFFDDAVDSAKIDRDAKIPAEVMDGLKALGLFGLQIPEEHGGLGLSNSAYARVAEEVCRDGSIAVTLLAHQSIGFKGILLNGNEEQKAKYLPRLATGEHVAAFALTEPSSGSDAASIRTRAKLNDAGTHYILNGEKIWISNGGFADIFTVFAKTEIDGKDKINAFIVERAFGGISSGKPEDKLGIRGSNTCAVAFQDCAVPVENLLGTSGGGFKVAMNVLNNGRFGLGAGSASQLRRVITMVADHATTRQQFGRPLAEFELIADKFANMAADTYACESIAYMTTGMIDRGDPDCYIEAAICKVMGSEASFRGINECIQIMGGMGFMKDYPYERLLRDSRILSIFEGTNEILRMLIALGGIRGVADNFKDLQSALKSPLSNYGVLVNELGRRVTRITGMGGDKLDVHPSLSEWATRVEQDSVRFGKEVERVVLKYRKNIMTEQLVCRNVADVAMGLYSSTAVLSRATASLNAGLPSAEHEAKLAALHCHDVFERNAKLFSELRDGAGKHKALKLAVAKDIFDHGGYIPPHPLGV